MKDEKGYTFIADSDCGQCLNTIYNSAVLNLLHRPQEIKGLKCESISLYFTFEEESEIHMVLNGLCSALKGQLYRFPDEIMGLTFTNGHFKRGVE